MLNAFEIAGRTAVITGGARGIGRSIGEAFLKAGASIILLDRDHRQGEETLRAMEEMHPGRSRFIALDVTDEADVRRVADDICRENVPDILVNNAGIVSNTPFADLTHAQWQDVVNVNLGGTFLCMQAFGGHMVKARKGSIVNISSICGDVAAVPQSQTAYDASKAGVNQLTRSLAAEWARHGVRVNAVAPGYVATDMTLAGRKNQMCYKTWIRMTPMARFAEPEEIANAVVFLASDAASFITGTILMADGGYTAI
ncbi:SDR family NAD(P)-dependent oxidoreductase [Gellertiella hungarica]|uniref:NAD(P)-dependent dehydrogenase (Short-subunit alcohol dehydrogenase family) n=1 Tax=Gellertiella hungarica TaxID=1572859 RepID=A0A7W6NKS1_9HYPH|nr:SDR family oxidoreductase [Gellertiella hungarica]MBB4065168.1 NAD(P)-dependent dehydrogenase (short-subunit alcohol dehydrogenase family) [Gellertiella hungarica]